jgi:L,D-transpeptidase YcbB
MKFQIHTVLVILFMTIPLLVRADSDETRQEVIRELLRNRLESGIHGNLSVSGEPIYSKTVLPSFYLARGFEPAWTEGGRSATRVDSLLEAIRKSYDEGLNPEDYHLQKLQEFVQESRHPGWEIASFNPGLLVDIELLSTDAYLILASHYLAGKVNPATLDNYWRANRRELDLANYLQEALHNGYIGSSLRKLLPVQPGYSCLREALLRYRDIEMNGGWPEITTGPLLRKGETGERVEQLRNRLILAGDIPESADTVNFQFDEELEAALKKFQSRHGLDADGIAGPATLRELNTPVKMRILAVELNLERWRWLPQDLGEKHILVNIAGFDVRVVESNNTVLEMKAVVGRLYRQTPVFSGRMTYLVLSPYWNVPPTISVLDVLPQVQKDTGYLARQNMKVFTGWGAETREINPDSVNWGELGRRNLPYRFRQDPGPQNALGTVKFMFPNEYHVYLHDSPARELFVRSRRDFSSGCIRLEKPLELAEYLLRGTRWSPEEIKRAIDLKAERTVTLPQPIPVHLLYWTAWSEHDGTIHFRADVYQRDEKLLNALKSFHPGKASPESIP